MLVVIDIIFTYPFTYVKYFTRTITGRPAFDALCIQTNSNNQYDTTLSAPEKCGARNTYNVEVVYYEL